MLRMLRALFRIIFGRRLKTARPEPSPSNESAGFATTRDAQTAMVNAILQLRAAVNTERAIDIDNALSRFKRDTDGILDSQERAGEIADAESMLAFIAVRERLNAGEQPAAIDMTSGSNPCYFRAAKVWLTRKREDDLGTFEITSTAIFYNGIDKKLSIPWHKLLRLDISGKTIDLYRTSGGEPLEFVFRDCGAARHAHLIGSIIWNQQRPAESTTRSRLTEALATSASPSAPDVGVTIELPGAGSSFPVGIVGESRRQGVLRALGGDRRRRNETVIFRAALVPEPNNPYDPNAIAVYIEGGAQIGYLAKEDAVDYRELARHLIERRAVGLCRAKLIGGIPDKPSVGVVLDLADPPSVLAAFGDVQPF
jgi:hypothetical protein